LPEYVTQPVLDGKAAFGGWLACGHFMPHPDFLRILDIFLGFIKFNDSHAIQTPE
jgi:hypothetical protein